MNCYINRRILIKYVQCVTNREEQVSPNRGTQPLSRESTKEGFMTYTKIAIIAGLSATLLAGTAMAAANFHYANGALVTSGPEAGNYTASFKETGLANTPITYDLEATVAYTFQCFTKSGNNPQGAPNS